MLAKGLSHRVVKEDEKLHLPKIQYSSSDSAADKMESISTPPRPPLIKANSFNDTSPRKPYFQSPPQPRTLNHRRKLRRSSLSDEIPENIQLTPPTHFRNRSCSQNARQNINCNASMMLIYGCLDNINSKLQVGNLSKTIIVHDIIQSITQVNILLNDNSRFLLMSNITNKCFDIVSTIFESINFETSKIVKLKENKILSFFDKDIEFAKDENELIISPIFNDLWMNTKLMLLKIVNNSTFYSQISLLDNQSTKTLIKRLYEFITNCNTNEGDQIKDVIDSMYRRISNFRKSLFTELLNRLLELLYIKKDKTNEIEKVDGLNRLLSLFDVFTFHNDTIIDKETLTRLYKRYILPFIKISNFSSFCDNLGNILNDYLNYDFHYSLVLLKYMKNHWPNQDGNKTSLFLVIIQNALAYLNSIDQFSKVYFMTCVDIFMISIRYHPVVTIDTFYEICSMNCVNDDKSILDKKMCKRMLEVLDSQESFVVSSCIHFTLLRLTLLRKK